MYSVGAPRVPIAATGPVRTILRVPPYLGCPATGDVVVGEIGVVGLVAVGAAEVAGSDVPATAVAGADAVGVVAGVVAGGAVAALEQPMRRKAMTKRTAIGIRYLFA